MFYLTRTKKLWVTFVYNSSSNGILGALVSAVMNQIADTMTDKSYAIAGITSTRLLSAGSPNGILYGPKSTKYGKDAQ